MEKQQIVKSGRQIALFMGQVIIFFLCLGYINFVYYETIAPDESVKDVFQPTTCTVMQKRLSEAGNLIRSYRADFLLSYSVNNNQYQGWVTGNGLDLSFTTNKNSQQDLFDQYSIGENYPCWFNPADPRMIVLVLRHNWMSTLPLLIPSIIAVIFFYYIMRSIFIFMGIMTVKTREIRKKRKAQRENKR